MLFVSVNFVWWIHRFYGALYRIIANLRNQVCFISRTRSWVRKQELCGFPEESLCVWAPHTPGSSQTRPFREEVKCGKTCDCFRDRDKEREAYFITAARLRHCLQKQSNRMLLNFSADQVYNHYYIFQFLIVVNDSDAVMQYFGCYNVACKPV